MDLMRPNCKGGSTVLIKMLAFLNDPAYCRRRIIITNRREIMSSWLYVPTRSAFKV